MGSKLFNSFIFFIAKISQSNQDEPCSYKHLALNQLAKPEYEPLLKPSLYLKIFDSSRILLASASLIPSGTCH